MTTLRIAVAAVAVALFAASCGDSDGFVPVAEGQTTTTEASTPSSTTETTTETTAPATETTAAPVASTITEVPAEVVVGQLVVVPDVALTGDSGTLLVSASFLAVREAEAPLHRIRQSWKVRVQRTEAGAAAVDLRGS